MPVYTSSGIGIGSSGFGLGGYAWSAILNCPVIILKYEFWHHGLNDMLLSYDFQPVDGDRSKMLANKGTGGDHTLIPVNVPGIDDVNPGGRIFCNNLMINTWQRNKLITFSATRPRQPGREYYRNRDGSR